jgi:hypothetical protein
MYEVERKHDPDYSDDYIYTAKNEHGQILILELYLLEYNLSKWYQVACERNTCKIDYRKINSYVILILVVLRLVWQKIRSGSLSFEILPRVKSF